MNTSQPKLLCSGVLALVVLTGLASCSGSAAAGGVVPQTTVRSQTAYGVDTAGMPEIELSELVAPGRVVFPELEGKSLDDATAWAEATGWEEIFAIDLDEEKMYQLAGQPASSRIILRHSDGIIVEGAAG